jgi:predicted esterase
LITAASPAAPADPDPILDQQVIAYFQTESEKERAPIAEKIQTFLEGDLTRLAAAIRRVNLWNEVASDTEHFQLQHKSADPTAVYVSLPAGYSPREKAWPLLITLHGTGGQAQNMLAVTTAMARPLEPDLIIAAPQSIQDGVFEFTEDEVDQPLQLLLDLHRRYRIDPDRVYLTGYSKGGHATCIIALMTADRWAGAVPLAGTVMLPQRRLFYDMILPNLQYLPVLICWGKQDMMAANGKPSPTGGIASANRVLSAAAKNAGLPWTPVEYPDLGHGGVSPPPDELRKILAARRARYPKSISHMYKFPSQGSAYWLRLKQFIGKPWADNTLHLKAKAGQSHQEVYLAGIKKRMALYTAAIDGQTVTIQSRRAARTELLLADELIDLSRPVTINMNKYDVYTGILPKSALIMLEEAHRTRDFSRLFFARVELPARGKPKFK